MSFKFRPGHSLVAQAQGLLDGPGSLVAKAANLSALLYMSLEDVNWAGFYFVENGELMLGPFQGKPACVKIALGEGVCGTAAATRTVQRVADVFEFKGHIACDADSRSELVVPLVLDGEVIGVLDIDSNVRDRFSEKDQGVIEKVVTVFLESIA